MYSLERRARIVVCAAMACTLGATSASPVSAPEPDPWFREIVRLWEEQRFQPAFDELLRYREEREYGRNEVVDYMIATCACRIGRPNLGRALFRSVLYHYSLDPDSRTLVRSELERCPPAAALRPVAIASNATGPVTSGTRGKMQYVIRKDGQREVPLANQPVRVLRKIPLEVFEQRLVEPGEPDSAVAAVRAVLAGAGNYRVLARGPFVLASRTHDAAGMREIADGLGAFLSFFQQAFGMPAPRHFLTVYLTPSSGEMVRLANRIHGIGLAPQAIGYSFRNDMSMVGIIPGQIYGTLAHELFHLMVRRDFGDLPPWLDEGYAALFEVSRRQPDGRVLGIDNWRGEVLETLWQLRPSIEELLRANWEAFEAQGDDVARQAANHATARYFALYLQERGRLIDVYRSFRDRTLLEITGSPEDDAVRRIESILGRDIEAVDEDFADWFRQLRR